MIKKANFENVEKIICRMKNGKFSKKWKLFEKKVSKIFKLKNNLLECFLKFRTKIIFFSKMENFEKLITKFSKNGKVCKIQKKNIFFGKSGKFNNLKKWKIF